MRNEISNQYNTPVFTVLLILFSVFACATIISAAPSTALEAVKDAQTKKQYLFVIFYENKDSLFKAMDREIDGYKKGEIGRPMIYRAKVSDDREADAVSKYRVKGAPLPLLLVIAPNGVVTGGFPQRVTAEQLKNSFPGPFILRILKPLQDGKVTLVMLQNGKTRFNKESKKAADGLSKTKGLEGFVEMIYSDPVDAATTDFRQQCGITGTVTDATIVMLVPPGKIGGVYKGGIKTETLMGGLKACSSGGCGSSCGPVK